MKQFNTRGRPDGQELINRDLELLLLEASWMRVDKESN